MNTNLVPIIVQKEVNPAEKQATRNPDRHPNYKKHFDQRQGQNEHKQKGYKLRSERTQNLHPQQKMRIFIQQDDQQSPSMKIYLGWTTSQTTRHFFPGICSLYRLISLSAASTKIKDQETTLQPRHQTSTLSSIKL